MSEKQTSDPDFRHIRRVAIIGAGGQMGGMFAARSLAAGYEVRAMDRPLSLDKLRQGIRGADLLLLSVPAKAVDEVLELAVQVLEPPQILIDNVSVKVQPLASMLKHYSGPVVGTHPLFGPTPPEDTRVALTPGRDDADGSACRAVADWMRGLGFTPFETTAEEHDRAAAVIQGLNFVTTVAYLSVLAHDKGVKQFLTPSFERRLEAARKMVTEDAELFAMLFETNPFSQDAVRSYRNYLHVAAGGDIDILVERAKWWLE